MTTVNIDHLRQWIGRSQEREDIITPRLVACFNAIFDAPVETKDGDEAPVGIHWCLAPDIAPMSALGPDGHPARGGFLPPVPFPRRMWAGGALNFAGRFRVGETVVRHSTIEDVALKEGRSGALIFVTVRHDYVGEEGMVLSERQDIVYREMESGGPAPAKPVETEVRPASEHVQSIDASPTLLFRYSAITFNGHRIHYDLAYVTREEGYPNLIFHGPLQASYLLRVAHAQGGQVLREFNFRSVLPLFAGGTISLHCNTSPDGAELFVADQGGSVTMQASARYGRGLAHKS